MRDAISQKPLRHISAITMPHTYGDEDLENTEDKYHESSDEDFNPDAAPAEAAPPPCKRCKTSPGILDLRGAEVVCK